jgi:predicted ATPase
VRASPGWLAGWPGLWRAGFADGAWLVELAPVQDPAQVPAVVAAALKVREQSGVPPAEVLGRCRCWITVSMSLRLLPGCAQGCWRAAMICGSW